MAGARTIKKEIKTFSQEYSSKKKLEVLAALKDNSNDVEKTAKLAGVSVVLIKDWVKESSGVDFIPDINKDLSLPGGSELEKLKAKSTIQNYKNRDIAITRLMTLIEKSDDLKEVTAATDVLNRIIKEDKEDSGGSGKGIGKNLTYNHINNQYITRKSNKKNGDN